MVTATIQKGAYTPIQKRKDVNGISTKKAKKRDLHPVRKQAQRTKMLIGDRSVTRAPAR